MKKTPMLLNYATNNIPVNDPESIAEIKLDGIRGIYISETNGKLYSKPGNDITNIFQEIVSSLTASHDIQLDGELIVEDDKGRPNFEHISSRFKSNKSIHRPIYCIFDILQYSGRSLANFSLMERKDILHNTIKENDNVKIVRHVEGIHAENYFNLCKEHDLEGIVIKKKNSIYRHGVRSKSWLKVINYKQAQIFIAGYFLDEYGFLIGIFEGNTFKIIGKLELGLSREVSREIYGKIRGQKVGQRGNAVYVEPIVRCNVEFRNWTSNGLMRLAVFRSFVT